ncbi:MAG: hypothetical protein RIS00_629 [Pseudomonadota bacterium]|jgi:hypothetical protein
MQGYCARHEAMALRLSGRGKIKQLQQTESFERRHFSNSLAPKLACMLPIESVGTNHRFSFLRKKKGKVDA